VLFLVETRMCFDQFSTVARPSFKVGPSDVEGVNMVSNTCLERVTAKTYGVQQKGVTKRICDMERIEAGGELKLSTVHSTAG
jgi:hypothetical protein